MSRTAENLPPEAERGLYLAVHELVDDDERTSPAARLRAAITELPPTWGEWYTRLNAWAQALTDGVPLPSLSHSLGAASAVAAAPLEAWRRWALAKLWLAQNQVERAMETLQEPPVHLSALAAGEWSALEGLVRRERGRPEEARELLRQALTHTSLLRPGALWLALAECERECGDEAAAVTAYQAAMSGDEAFVRACARLRLADIRAEGPLALADILPLPSAASQDAMLRRVQAMLEETHALAKGTAEAARAEIERIRRDAELTHVLGVLATRYPPLFVQEVRRQALALAQGRFKGRLLVEHVQRRRVFVTCLSLDLLGFTAHFKALDAEDQLRFLNEFHARATHLIHHDNGVVSDMGTRHLTAFFGLMDPPGDEDAARQSARDSLDAAFALHADMIAFFKSVKRMFFELPVEKIRLEKGGYDLRERRLGLGIGLASGYCQAGMLAQGDASARLYVGHAVNIAQRLVRAARPREVLVSQATRDLLARDPALPIRFEERSARVDYDGDLHVGQLKDYENIAFYAACPKET